MPAVKQRRVAHSLIPLLVCPFQRVESVPLKAQTYLSGRTTGPPAGWNSIRDLCGDESRRPYGTAGDAGGRVPRVSPGAIFVGSLRERVGVWVGIVRSRPSVAAATTRRMEHPHWWGITGGAHGSVKYPD